MKTDCAKLCDLLYGGNYMVSLFDFTEKHPADTSLDQVLETLLPNVVLGDCVQVTASEAISEVRTCLNYLGKESHGPDKDKIESREFTDLRASYLEEIFELCAYPTEVFSLSSRPDTPLTLFIGILPLPSGDPSRLGS